MSWRGTEVADCESNLPFTHFSFFKRLPISINPYVAAMAYPKYGRRTLNNRALAIGGLLLLLPITMSIVLSLGKHEGSITAPSPQTKVKESPAGVMSDIPSAANTALVKYIDALTNGLHTGSSVDIKKASVDGCPCRIIGDSFEAIYTKANLVGGAYSLKRSSVVKRSDHEITLKVTIKMTDTTHIVRKTGEKQLWKGTDITAYFTLTQDGSAWKIRNTSEKP